MSKIQVLTLKKILSLFNRLIILIQKKVMYLKFINKVATIIFKNKFIDKTNKHNTDKYLVIDKIIQVDQIQE